MISAPGGAAYYFLVVVFALLFFSFFVVFVRLPSFWQGMEASARRVWRLVAAGMTFRFALFLAGLLFAWYSQPPFVVFFMLLYLALFFYFLGLELIAWSHFLNWFDK
jgi:hypothetical protein